MRTNIFLMQVILLCAILSRSTYSLAGGDGGCTRNGVGNSLMESLDYMAANHLIGSTSFTSSLNLVWDGDFEKDLSGLTLQYMSVPADFQCVCSGPSPNCNPHAVCNGGGTSPVSTYYNPTNYTDMLNYLDFTSQLSYSWDWNTAVKEYFAIRNSGTLALGPDHTSIAYSYGGQAMLVSGAGHSTYGHEVAWQKTFHLLPNRTYTFTYWFKNLNKTKGAQIAFGIPLSGGAFQNLQNLKLDGSAYTGTLPYVESDYEWHKFSGTVSTTGTNTTTTIAIYVYDDAEGGRSLIAYDDISMIQMDSCSNNWCQIFPDHLQMALSVPTVSGNCTQCNVSLMRSGSTIYDFLHIIHFSNLRPDPAFPGSRNAFLVDIETADPSHPGAAHTYATMRGFYDCDYIFDCPPKSCCVIKGTQVNPFVQGLRGNWKANKGYLYNANRQYDPTPTARTNQNQGLYVRQSGIYDQFSEFWHYSGTKWDTPGGIIPANWSWKAEVTKMNPYGADVENRDPLYRYSAAVYGYNYSAAIAVGNNTRYRQMAFDGFEDYEFFDPTCEARHFNIENPHLSSKAHTGLMALEVMDGHNISISRSITPAGTPEPTVTDTPFGNPFTVNEHDMLGVFAPDDNNDYVLSFWTYEMLPQEKDRTPGVSAGVFDYPHPHIIIRVDGTVITPTSEQHGKMIDRWQQINYTFHIPNHGSTLTLEYVATTLPIMYDDVRIYPAKATMKSYVYNPVTLKLMAELDENNYATFYEYDLEGKLSRVKKETEKGIYSIQESRTSMPKK